MACDAQGAFAQLQSQARVAVDGRALLAAGLNVSVPDGRLSLLLSASPPDYNQTQPSLGTALTAQLKGRLVSILLYSRLLMQP